MKWKLKVLVQFVLSHIPGGEAVNYLLQHSVGSHSAAILKARISEPLDFLTSTEPPLTVLGRRVVEMGTGWDGLAPLVLSVLGAESVVTFDHVRHFRFDLGQEALRALSVDSVVERLNRIEGGAAVRLRALAAEKDLDALLHRAKITYVAPGDATQTGLPNNSIDIVYSYAVLEHVSEKVIVGFLREARRILKADGIIACVIGLGDHYTSVDPSLTFVNFLKYPEWAWALLVKNKISYHNRLREKQFLEIFANEGARVVWKKSHIRARDVAAAANMHVDQRFAGMTPEELAVYRLDVVLSFPTAGT
jgi:SAM-dependent methyltransferase